jgi:hypothetical protein
MGKVGQGAGAQDRRLPFAPAHDYVPAMDAKFWKRALKEAERELDAATRLADLNEAARKLMRAKEALKRLDVST